MILTVRCVHSCVHYQARIYTQFMMWNSYCTILVWSQKCLVLKQDFLLLGLNVLWSGSTGELDTSNDAYGYIIPAFVKYLMTVQPPYPYPPNPEVGYFVQQLAKF